MQDGPKTGDYVTLHVNRHTRYGRVKTVRADGRRVVLIAMPDGLTEHVRSALMLTKVGWADVPSRTLKLLLES